MRLLEDGSVRLPNDEMSRIGFSDVLNQGPLLYEKLSITKDARHF